MPVVPSLLPPGRPTHSNAGQENSDTFLLVTPVVKIVCIRTHTVWAKNKCTSMLVTDVSTLFNLVNNSG